MKIFSTIIALLIILSIITSCKTSNNVVSDNIFQKRKYKSGFYVDKHLKKNKIDVNVSNISPNDKFKNTITKFEFPKEPTLLALSEDDNLDYSDSESYLKINSNNPDSCDIMILSNGDEIVAKVTEIGLDVIKYKDCDNINGPAIVISKNDVFMIKYPNGTKTVITKVSSYEQQSDINSQKNQYKKKTETLSLLSFIFSIVGFFAFSILLGPAAFIMGLAGINKIVKEPQSWKGKGFAIAGIIIGLIDTIAILIILASI